MAHNTCGELAKWPSVGGRRLARWDVRKREDEELFPVVSAVTVWEPGGGFHYDCFLNPKQRRLIKRTSHNSDCGASVVVGGGERARAGPEVRWGQLQLVTWNALSSKMLLGNWPLLKNVKEVLSRHLHYQDLHSEFDRNAHWFTA